MPQANSNETPPETMAEAYAEMDLLLTKAFDEPINQDPTTHAWQQIGQIAAQVGRRFKFKDSTTDTEQFIEIIDRNEEQNELTVQVSGQEEPSKIHTSIFRSAADYTIEHKKTVVVVSIAMGSLYIWAKNTIIQHKIDM